LLRHYQITEFVTYFRHGCACLLVVDLMMSAVLTLWVGQTGRGVKGKALPPSSGYLEGEAWRCLRDFGTLYQNERCHNP